MKQTAAEAGVGPKECRGEYYAGNALAIIPKAGARWRLFSIPLAVSNASHPRPAPELKAGQKPGISAPGKRRIRDGLGNWLGRQGFVLCYCFSEIIHKNFV